MGKRVYAPQGGAKSKKRALTKRSKKQLMRARADAVFWGNSVAKPMPFKFKFQTRYAQNFSLNPGASGTAAVNVFRANDLYDPDLTGVGHQPVGFDQIMTMYNHFTVIASKIRVSFFNEDSARAPFVGIALQGGSAVEADLLRYIENGACRYERVGEQGTGGSHTTVTMQCNVSQWLGRPSLLSEDDCRGSTAGSPTEQVYYHVWAAPNSSADHGNINCLVQIDYVAILTEPKDLSAS